MTSKGDDKTYCSAVSQHIYDLLTMDMSCGSAERNFFDVSISTVFLVVPFPSFVEASHSDVVVISKDAIQDVLVQQQCVSKVGFVLYKCQHHMLSSVTESVLHDEADPTACVIVIDDGHSLLTPFEFFSNFAQQFRSIVKFMRRISVLKETDSNEEKFQRSGKILAIFLQASDKSKITRIDWNLENSSEVWLASNRILTPTVIQSILSLPGVHRVRALNRPPFYTTLAANDRCCIQILFKHQGRASEKFLALTFNALNDIALRLFANSKDNNFQRKIVLLTITATDKFKLQQTQHLHHKVCTIPLDALDDEQIVKISNILQELRIYHYILPRKTIFIYGSGTVMETIRLKCVDQDVLLPIGRKQESYQLTFECKHTTGTSSSLLRESIGEISRELVQIVNQPGLFTLDGTGESAVATFLKERFDADNFEQRFVRYENSETAAVLAFDIPISFADKVPIQIDIEGYETMLIQFLCPLMKSEKAAAITQPAEDKTDAFMNSFQHPKKRSSKVSSVAPWPANPSSWSRFQTVSPHLFVNNRDVSLPCSTMDEPFPWIFVASQLTIEEFHAIIMYFAEEPRYFQHHTWIPSLLELPTEKKFAKVDAGPGVYHLRCHSYHPLNILQPRFEAGRVIVGRSNALRLLVYEHADLIVFVPPCGALSQLFDDVSTFYIVNHKAVKKDDYHFDFARSVPEQSDRPQSPPPAWTQSDFMSKKKNATTEEDDMDVRPTACDSSDTDMHADEAMDNPSKNDSVSDIEHGTPCDCDPYSLYPDNSSREPIQTTNNNPPSAVGPNQNSSNPPSNVVPPKKDKISVLSPKGKDQKECDDQKQLNLKQQQPVIPLVVGSKKDKKDNLSEQKTQENKNLQTQPKESNAQLILSKIIELKDFIGSEPLLSALHFSENDVQRAASFLLRLPEVSCYYVAATRLMSKAKWSKDHKLDEKDLQSFVLMEIAKGWTLATGRPHSKFTRFHLALVLGAYTSLDPFMLDSLPSAIFNILEHMIPEFHQILCTKVSHSCPVCRNTVEWSTPFFESTMKNYDALSRSTLKEVFLNCHPAREKFPGTNECCETHYDPEVKQYAGIKLVNLQFFDCALPKVSLYTELLTSDAFCVGDESWSACAVVIHTLPDHFYTIEKADIIGEDQTPLFVKHDNAVGFQRGQFSVKDEDQITAILFRRTDVKAMWPNVTRAHLTRKTQDKMRTPQPTTDKVKKGPKIRKHTPKAFLKAANTSLKATQLSPCRIFRPSFFSKDNRDKSKTRSECKASTSKSLDALQGVDIPIVSSDEDLQEKPPEPPRPTSIGSQDPISQFSNDEVKHNEGITQAMNRGHCDDSKDQDMGRPLGFPSEVGAQHVDSVNHQHPEEQLNSAVDNLLGHSGGEGSESAPVPKPLASKGGPPLNGDGSEGKPLGGPSPAPAIQPDLLTTGPAASQCPSHNSGSELRSKSVSSRAPYALISLFDGCGSTYSLVKDLVGYPPTVFLAAEWDQHLRAIVADALGLSLDQQWHHNKYGSKSCYLSDVDSMFSNDSAVLRSFLALLPEGCKVLIIGGSPCTELTRASADKGRLGLAGPASCLFFTIHLLIFMLQSVLPTTHIRFLVENAGSMLPLHHNFIRWSLGIAAIPLDQLVWDANTLGIADRKRFFFQNHVPPRGQPATLTVIPFPDGWGPLPFFEGSQLHFVTAKVFMRPRDELNDGLVQRSWSSYHPYSLVWDYSFFGSARNLAEQAKISKYNSMPLLTWSSFIPPMFLADWIHFIKTICNFEATYDQKERAIFAIMPLLHNPKVRLPFRLITPKEATIISGIDQSFAKAEKFPHLQSEFVVLSAVGNSFHPALIAAALGNREQLQGWLTSEFVTQCQVVSPHEVVKQFPKYRKEIDQSTAGLTHHKTPVDTPYRHLRYEVNLSRLSKAPTVLPLQLAPALPQHLQVKAWQAQINELRSKRHRMIDLEVVNILNQVNLADLVDSWFVPAYRPFQTVVNTIMGKEVGHPSFPQRAIFLAQSCVQNRATWDALIMLYWSLFSGTYGHQHRALFLGIFKSANDPRVVMAYSEGPKDVYVLVQQPEGFQVALAGIDPDGLAVENIQPEDGSEVQILRLPFCKSALFSDMNVEGFVLPSVSGSVVGIGPGLSGCLMQGCPAFLASSLHRLSLGRPDDVVSSLPCHQLCSGLPIALVHANISQNKISISEVVFRSAFDWTTLLLQPTPAFGLLILQFVTAVQPLVIGELYYQFPAITDPPICNPAAVMAWISQQSSRHQCGFSSYGPLGFLCVSGDLLRRIAS